jgi:hypothetical protein
MTRVSKALVLLGAASMAVSPVLASAQGNSDESSGPKGLEGLGGLEIAALAIALGGLGVLVASGGKSN